MTTANLKHSLEQAIRMHREQATQCEALLTLANAISNRMTEQIPVQLLVDELLKIGLCVLHRGIVKQAIDYIDDELSSNYEHDMREALSNALKGKIK